MNLLALDQTELAVALSQLPQWRYLEPAIQRDYLFNDFAQAFAFMSKVAELAEQQAHHPDWSNSYNKVQIRLITHQINALSQRDIQLAIAIDALYQKQSDTRWQ